MKVSAILMTVVLAFLSTAGVKAAGKALTADEIMKKTVQSAYAPSEQSTYVMKLKDKDGSEKLRKMKVWFKREGDDKAKLLIKFSEPADIRGTGLLSVGEKGKSADQWIYLPGVKKVRRIKGGNENESFLGSDFTVGDLSVERQDKYDYELGGNEKCGEAQCYVLSGKPRAGIEADELPYSKKILLVRTDNFMATEVKFFDKDGKQEKVMRLAGFHKEAGDKWMADKTEMQNLMTGHSTVIEVAERNTKTEPSDSMFTTSALERN